MKPNFFVEGIIFWNHKLHIYIGLFLLLFILFFSISGLIFNHSNWSFTSFWKERKETELISNVIISENSDSIALIDNLTKQLKFSGEISNVKINSESINFRIVKPGITRDITVDRKNGKCISKEIAFNFWGKIRSLHTFNGSDKLNQGIKLNWLFTRIWRLVMDSIALGLIFLCISSWIMWFNVRKSYPLGLMILILGAIGAFYFVYILRIL
jgi:hypothetical protein